MSKKVSERSCDVLEFEANYGRSYGGQWRRFRRPNWTVESLGGRQEFSDYSHAHRRDTVMLQRPRSNAFEGTAVSLFIDGFPRNVLWRDLKRIFSSIGNVVDLFVSKKLRKNRDGAFGFVRYGTMMEAERAISNLEGIMVGGKSMSVSFAQFHKGGVQAQKPILMPTRGEQARQPVSRPNHISTPSWRDSRRYADVVRGKKDDIVVQRKETAIIPVSFSLWVPLENLESRQLQYVVVVERDDVLDGRGQRLRLRLPPWLC
ncbi:unnamed protein product [Amaranthus hypochondriacus]